MIDIRVPALGESVTEATVATWLKKPGDALVADETICELETDKVTLEVPAPGNGILSNIEAAEGDTVAADALLATMQAGNGDAAASAAPDRDASPPGKRAEGSAEPVDVLVPALGESVAEATVSAWLVGPGDRVAADDVLCELETDKVSLEVPAPVSGTLRTILAEAGASVAAGSRIGEILAGDAPPEAAGPDSEASPPRPEPQPSQAPGPDVEHAPSARRLMAQHGIGGDQVTATGRDGRIMKNDVQEVLDAGYVGPMTDTPAPRREPVPDADSVREERVRMTRLRQTIARRLKDAQNTAAILTTYNEIDMSAIMDVRREYKDLFLRKHGVKLGFMSFFTRACCVALGEVPELNAEIDGDELVYKNFVHMGVAVGTPTGLVVPVIRDAHALGFAEIEERLSELGERARSGRLSVADLQGGTFTISNGGVYGSLMSSPILNPPQSGILGMHKIQERPVVAGGEVVVRPMMYLALSYDHRIVDGKGAVTFLVRIKEMLEAPSRMLMGI